MEENILPLTTLPQAISGVLWSWREAPLQYLTIHNLVLWPQWIPLPSFHHHSFPQSVIPFCLHFILRPAQALRFPSLQLLMTVLSIPLLLCFSIASWAWININQCSLLPQEGFPSIYMFSMVNLSHFWVRISWPWSGDSPLYISSPALFAVLPLLTYSMGTY